MKTIGLLGGLSWESSREYYRIINEAVAQHLGGVHSAACILYSVDFAEIEHLQHQDRWEEAGSFLSQAAQRVEQAGADLLLICSNTMHRVAEAIEGQLSIPLLHIADPTAEAINAHGIRTIGLLGTRFTMEQPFYRGRLENKYGLNIVIPSQAERQVVHEIIYHELVRGIITSESRQRYQEIMTGLISRGAEGIILGCTEIMLLIRPEDIQVPTFDTTTLHALAAVNIALATTFPPPVTA
ncbi:aspartate/glutamate racemase family protein [Dictyobacter arantiisoli]|uniref:Aspartate racemase n=1 Tax=Dictyobacter arantiisoli TaxID=2014874 RepID=A0A5A5TKV8_9CHLR|nr:aspartate/glutamate racemase family protein [Dictyobacter arantiisoli]GCF11719.1 aspartate racemase [Dictyobacter arantiisoli]